MKNLMVWGAFMTLATMLVLAAAKPSAPVGNSAPVSEYKIMAPITHGALTIFPVVAEKVHDTSGFITLDEGMRSGEIVVTEVGKIAGMIRRRPSPTYQQASGAEVNRLVLVNNSKLPLTLLAAEVVTPRKQDPLVRQNPTLPSAT